MDPRHQEYLAYYEARARRYSGNPMYRHSHAAEQALAEAIRSAADLEEFGRRVREGRLEVACAVARVRDLNEAWAAEFEERGEVVRAGPHREILRRLDERSWDDVQALLTMVGDVETRWQLTVAADETLRTEFWGDWKILEDIEEDERAAVPERWHDERARAVQRERARGTAHWREHTLPNARNFFPDYEPDWASLWEPRHRRRFPVADEPVRRRIAAHKRYVGVE